MGDNEETLFELAYSIDGGTNFTTEIFTETLQSGQTTEYTFNETADFSQSATYNCIAKIIIPNDGNPDNDQAEATVMNLPLISEYPYSQDFENESFWSSGILEGTNNTWELAEPSGQYISSASSGRFCWVINPQGQYPNNEFSFVESPCLDLSTLESPVLQFRINYHTEAYWDGATFKYSTDDGNSWNVLGQANDPYNWFNYEAIYAFQTNTPGWSDNSGGWITARHSLGELSGQSQVKLRVIFASDNVVNNFEGFAFDDVFIYDATYDLEVTEFNVPQIDCNEGAIEELSITVRNSGMNEIQEFEISYSVDGGENYYTESIEQTLETGDTYFHTFSQQADFTEPGIYTCIAKASYPGDGNDFNDTLIKPVYSKGSIQTLPFTDNFQN